MNPEDQGLPLRDLHLPEAVGWWPPAPGWWALLVGLILLLLLGWWAVRLYRKRRLRRAALAELKSVELIYRDNGDRAEFVRRMSVLLRRVAISFYPRENVAGLSGEAWLQFLDQGVEGEGCQGGFTTGAGKALIEAPYNPNCEVDVEAISRLADVWVGRVTQGQGSGK